MELSELRLGFGELEEQDSVSRCQLNLEVEGCLGLRDELKAFYFFEPFFFQSLAHVFQWQLVQHFQEVKQLHWAAFSLLQQTICYI